MNYITPKKTKKSKYNSKNETLPKSNLKSKKSSRYSFAKINKANNNTSLKKLLNNNNKEINRICLGINFILTEIISKNKFLPEYSSILKNQNKLFDLKSEPKISINKYLNRIILYSKIELSTIVVGLIYFNRILEKGLMLTEYNVHKLLCISILIAIKYNEDKISNNEYYSKIFGLSLKLVNHLEYSYLKLLDYKLYVEQQYIKNFYHYINTKIFVDFKI